MPTTTSQKLAALLNVFRSIPDAELAKAAEDLGDAVSIPGTKVGNGEFQDQLGRFAADTGVPLPMSGKGPQKAYRSYSDVNALTGLALAYARACEALDREVEARKAQHRDVMSFVAAASRKLGLGDAVQKAAEHMQTETAADRQERLLRLTDILSTTKSVLAHIIKAEPDDDDAADAAEGRADVEKAVQHLQGVIQRVTKAIQALAAAEKAAPTQEGPDWMAMTGADADAAESQDAASKAMTLTAVLDAMSGRLQSPPDLSGRTTAVAKANVGPTDEDISRMNPADAIHAMTMRQRAAFERATGLKVRNYANYSQV